MNVEKNTLFFIITLYKTNISHFIVKIELERSEKKW